MYTGVHRACISAHRACMGVRGDMHRGTQVYTQVGAWVCTGVCMDVHECASGMLS